MNNLHIETPLLESTPLSKHLGKKIYLKMESMQPPGSFKIRGIGKLCQQLAKNGAKGFVSSSGGNAGLAVAYAGRKLELPVTVYVPETSSKWIRDKIEAEGAKVIVHGKNWKETDILARKVAEKEGLAYTHPFDHPLIWEGHATMIHEVIKSGFQPDAVVCSVGGGGLFCGVVQGLHDVGCENVPVIAVETEGAAGFNASIKAGKPIFLDKLDTIAVTLAAPTVTPQALKWTKSHKVIPITVSDKQAVRSCLKFADDHRNLVEPACGAALAAVYDKLSVLDNFEKVLVVVCGGSGITIEMLNQWKKQFNL